MRLAVLCATTLTLALSGCASIVSKSNWPVQVTSSPENAEVEIRNKSGEVVHKGRAPFTVTLKSGAGYFSGENYSLIGHAPGHAEGNASLNTEMNGWFIGNIVFGGLIGFLIVDPLTGAMWRLPEKVHVALPAVQS